MIAWRRPAFNREDSLGIGHNDSWQPPAVGIRAPVSQANRLPDVAGIERAELETLLEAAGVEPYRARQIYRWVFARGLTDFGLMTDLSKPLRARLSELLRISHPAIVGEDHSSDGTIKLLLELDDRRRIEAVFIPESPGDTFCISTQVGCAMKCAFCLTGTMGLARNLAAGEIVGQVQALVARLGLLDARFNIVLMGMGEPLHNYDETMKALRILSDADGLAVSPRRVTISTVGVVPALERLAREAYMPNLAVSLHATTEAQRDLLVPLNRKYNIAEVIEACRRFPLTRRSRITFEYVMLAGVNDSPQDARRLVSLLGGLKAKVNLIPLNEAAGIPFSRPSDERVDAFARILADRRLAVSVRKSRGRDIRAACGQLIVEGTSKSAGQKLAAAMDR
jgi:23S rRNA (adenine2503-C2)-methyltransferase